MLNFLKNVFSFQKDVRVKKIEDMLCAFRKNNDLPIYLSADLKDALRVLASAKNWQKLVDESTISELLNVYNKWQFKINGANSKQRQVQKTTKSFGFKRKQAWEGTAEEYAAAIAIGELSPDDEYRIIEYLPGYTIMDENGEITEQMD